jgi:hypothetical protein
VRRQTLRVQRHPCDIDSTIQPLVLHKKRVMDSEVWDIYVTYRLL